MKQNYLKENTTGTDQYDEINSILYKQSSYQGNSSTKARAGRVTSCIGQSRAVASCSVLLLHDASSSARSAARRGRAFGGSAMLISKRLISRTEQGNTKFCIVSFLLRFVFQYWKPVKISVTTQQWDAGIFEPHLLQASIVSWRVFIRHRI
jgi:hypothetical protein